MNKTTTITVLLVLSLTACAIAGALALTSTANAKDVTNNTWEPDTCIEAGLIQQKEVDCTSVYDGSWLRIQPAEDFIYGSSKIVSAEGNMCSAAPIWIGSTGTVTANGVGSFPIEKQIGGTEADVAANGVESLNPFLRLTGSTTMDAGTYVYLNSVLIPYTTFVEGCITPWIGLSAPVQTTA